LNVYEDGIKSRLLLALISARTAYKPLAMMTLTARKRPSGIILVLIFSFAFSFIFLLSPSFANSDLVNDETSPVASFCNMSLRDLLQRARTTSTTNFSFYPISTFGDHKTWDLNDYGPPYGSSVWTPKYQDLSARELLSYLAAGIYIPKGAIPVWAKEGDLIDWDRVEAQVASDERTAAESETLKATASEDEKARERDRTLALLKKLEQAKKTAIQYPDQLPPSFWGTSWYPNDHGGSTSDFEPQLLSLEAFLDYRLQGYDPDAIAVEGGSSDLSLIEERLRKNLEK